MGKGGKWKLNWRSKEKGKGGNEIEKKGEGGRGGRKNRRWEKQGGKEKWRVEWRGCRRERGKVGGGRREKGWEKEGEK